jgi:diaminobutyrate-2-oxoglutarate transaminase
MAAGTATLAHVRENRLAERAATLGARMLARLGRLAEEHPCVGEVRGRGLMLGLELVDPEGERSGGEAIATATATATGVGVGQGVALTRTRSAEPRPAAPELAAAVQRECLRRGLIVELGGRHASVVRLLPPLTITDEQAAAVLDRLADAVEAVASTAADLLGRGSTRPGPPRRQRGSTRPAEGTG